MKMAAASSSGGLNLESLTHVDINALSQSELYSLSKCSNSAFDLHRPDDVVLPNIDRSFFNESAGSRRQTYSRLRQKHHHHHHLHPRTRLPDLLPRSKLHPSSDPENHAILHYLKHYLYHNSATNCPPPAAPPPPPPPPQPVGSELGLQEKMAIAVNVVEKKKKRGRKLRWNPGFLDNGAAMELERVNRNGVEVDFGALERNGDELYSAELRRRTMGLDTEEEVLEFLRGLEGQWCSRRKKRKYVDAVDFGDSLPVGWKLLLGLRRRDGRVTVYCRRIISPTGEQLLSCKEASALLCSYFEAKISNQSVNPVNCQVEQAGAVASGSNAGFVNSADKTRHEISLGSTVIYSTAYDAHENEVGLMDIDNLSEVQVRDLFECYKCNLSFDKRNLYLQHLMAFHQQTTRTYKFGETVTDGVIIKDGKFECQFCHKVFLERCSYNGHVGVHVRNQVKGSEELHTPDSGQKSTESPSQEGLCQRTCTNALIEIAQKSMSAALSAGPSSASNKISCPIVMNLNETLAGSTNHGTTLDSDFTQLEDHKAEKIQVLSQPGSESMMDDGRTMNSNNRQTFEIHLKEVLTEHAEELKEYGNNNVDISFGDRTSKQSDNIANSEGPIVEENVLQNGISSSSVPLVQPFDYFSSVPDKGADDFFLDSQKLENLQGFEELDLDDMETFKYDFVDKQDSSSLLEVSMDLASDTGKGEELNASVGFDSQTDPLNMTGTHQFTTICVWCRSEFKVETIHSELQSDSIGYMCTTCKDKISGHFDRICH